jgi:cytochrome c oxidase subunit 3
MSAASMPSSEILDRQAVRGASSSVIAMIIFVASEAVFFGAFFGIYMTAYTSEPTWPPAGLPGPPLALSGAAVAVVLISGITMAQVLRRIRRSDYPRGVLTWLSATLICAVIFGVLLALGYQGIGFGIGQNIFGSLFYMITGLELAHAVGGIVLLALVIARGWAGELALHRDPVVAAGIYWYFVVALGLVIYVVLYVAPAG